MKKHKVIHLQYISLRKKQSITTTKTSMICFRVFDQIKTNNSALFQEARGVAELLSQLLSLVDNLNQIYHSFALAGVD